MYTCTYDKGLDFVNNLAQGDGSLIFFFFFKVYLSSLSMLRITTIPLSSFWSYSRGYKLMFLEFLISCSGSFEEMGGGNQNLIYLISRNIWPIIFD